MLCVVIALLTGQVPDWEAAVKRRPNAANYRQLADAYVSAARFDKASEAFAKASVLYRKLGDPNAAKVLDLQARRYRTEIRVFAELPGDAALAPTNWTRARWEPMTGCFLGVNIEREDGTRDAQAFNNIMERRHAMFFTYRSYGMPFPTDVATRLRRARAALQIAFEPRDLYQIQNDVYLHKFAEDAYKSGIPVFLRFASEMNGSWVRYGQDPQSYRNAFRLVASVMHAEAPNVAMVWCPNEIPEETISRYYPGPDAVDWVGVNFYSVIYNDSDRARGAEWKHPIDAIDYMYRNYARMHPMMIGEWAATHRASLDSMDRPDFARGRIGQFYTAIPRLYPRIKAINWLSMNTINYARPGRQLNNYSLLDDRSVEQKYRETVASRYFLDEVVDEPTTAPVRYVEVRSGLHLPRGTKLSAFVRTYDSAPTVTAWVNGKLSMTFNEPSAYEINGPGSPAKVSVEYRISDSQNRIAGAKKLTLVFD